MKIKENKDQLSLYSAEGVQDITVLLVNNKNYAI